MIRNATGLAAAALCAAVSLSAASALAQTPTLAQQSPAPPAARQAPPAMPETPAATPQAPAPGKPGARGRPAPDPATKKKTSGAAAETRFRLVLDFAIAPQTLQYEDLRTPTAFVETSRIATSYEAGTGLGPSVALQTSLYRGLGVLVGYSYITRDVTGIVDVSRPHPLHLNRLREADPVEITGAGYSEGAIDVDLAYVHAGRFEWAIFGGVTFFDVEADLLDVPTFTEIYPYDDVAVASAPTVAVSESATGWNVGGRLDYRFGKSMRFGLGVTVKYSAASVELAGTQVATPAKVDAGGLLVGGGVRFYF